METLGDFARKNRLERAGIPTIVKIGENTYKGVGLDWILENPILSNHPLGGFVKWHRGTSIVGKEDNL
ncbi:MAG: hypothetical protein HFF85_07260 [Oscillibacter sp.]|nr:hypothetical protein [Oscillibacter sp.]